MCENPEHSKEWHNGYMAGAAAAMFVSKNDDLTWPEYVEAITDNLRAVVRERNLYRTEARALRTQLLLMTRERDDLKDAYDALVDRLDKLIECAEDEARSGAT